MRCFKFFHEKIIRYKEVLLYTLIVKAVIFLVAWYLIGLMPFSQYDFDVNGYHYPDQNHSVFEKAFAPQDGQWYLEIAKYGYTGKHDGYDPGTRKYAFFPLYPALIRLFSVFTSGNLYISGILVSLLASIVGVIYFYELILLDFSKKIALNSVFYFLIFPMSIFYSAIFTESLFFLCSIATFYYCRKRQWWLCGIFGFFAAITRSPGVLLLVPVVYEYDLYVREINSQSFVDFIRKAKYNFLSILLIPLGLLSYFYYSFRTSGDFFAPVNALKTWGRSSLNIPHIFSQFYDRIMHFSTLPLHSFRESQLDIIFTLFFLALLLPMIRKIRKSYLIYSLLIIISPFSSGMVMSMIRYVSISFPQYLFLGYYGSKNEFINKAIIVLFLFLLSIFTFRFMNWYWVA